MRQLPDVLSQKVDQIAEKGNQLMDARDYASALEVFRCGLALLPEPRFEWEAAAWFLAGIGDAQWHLGDLGASLDTWRDALLHGGLGNPFVHLRRGQALYDLGRAKESADELLRALLLAGEGIFAEEDPKYLKHVRSTAAPPQGRASWDGWTGLPPDSPIRTWLMDASHYTLQAKGAQPR